MDKRGEVGGALVTLQFCVGAGTMAYAIMGGLAVATLLTLVFLPADLGPQRAVVSGVHSEFILEGDADPAPADPVCPTGAVGILFASCNAFRLHAGRANRAGPRCRGARGRIL